MAKREVIDGYELEVSESKEFLSEVEEAALLLLDPSYFGAVPKIQALSEDDKRALRDNSLPKWNHSVAHPSKILAGEAAKLSKSNVDAIIVKLAARIKPLCVVRLRCGEIYCGSALNYFYDDHSAAS